MRYQTQESQRCRARVLELMFDPPGHEHGRSRLQKAFLLTLHHNPISLQHKHFVLVGMAMQRRVPPRCDLKMSHRKGGGPIRFVDKTADLAPGRAGHVNRRRFNLIVGNDLHKKIPRVVSLEIASHVVGCLC